MNGLDDRLGNLDLHLSLPFPSGLRVIGGVESLWVTAVEVLATSA